MGQIIRVKDLLIREALCLPPGPIRCSPEERRLHFRTENLATTKSQKKPDSCGNEKIDNLLAGLRSILGIFDFAVQVEFLGRELKYLFTVTHANGYRKEITINDYTLSKANPRNMDWERVCLEIIVKKIHDEVTNEQSAKADNALGFDGTTGRSPCSPLP